MPLTLWQVVHSTQVHWKGAWKCNAPLATVSEAYVKADKATEANGELQEKTVEYLKSRHSADDRTGSTMAEYAREEVMGPLSGAEGKEDTNTDADDMDVYSSHKQRSTVEAFSAGGETIVRETVEEADKTQVHSKKNKTLPENPTMSEEAVRADAGKPIYT